MSALDTQLKAGMRIGSSPWILQRRLGKGAFGEVWAAQHEHTLVIAAIKILVAIGVGEKSAILEDKVLRAAQLLVRVDHPHVVKVLDVGYVGEAPKRIWVVMELLDGRELSKVIAEGPMEPRRALRHIAAAAAAVATVHAAATAAAALERSVNPDADRPEFVHRDLKPDNLMLVEGRAGEMVKVLDFDAAHMPRAKSMVGQIVGTPYYMSPEQYRGEKLDSRSDVWALGVILYEMLTGKKPFGGSNIAELAAAVIRQPVPSPSAPLPPELWQLIVRATQKSRAERPTIDDFAAETQRLLRADPSSGAALVHTETERLSSAEIAHAVAASSPGVVHTVAGAPLAIPGQQSTHQAYTAPPAGTARSTLSTSTAITIAVAAVAVVTGIVVAVTTLVRSEAATPASETSTSSEPREAPTPSGEPELASTAPAPPEPTTAPEADPTSEPSNLAAPPPPPPKALPRPAPVPRPAPPPPPPPKSVRW